MFRGHSYERLSSEAFSVTALPRVREGLGYKAFGPTFEAFAVAAEAVKDWAWTSTSMALETSINAAAYRKNVLLTMKAQNTLGKMNAAMGLPLRIASPTIGSSIRKSK